MMKPVSYLPVVKMLRCCISGFWSCWVNNSLPGVLVFLTKRSLDSASSLQWTLTWHVPNICNRDGMGGKKKERREKPFSYQIWHFSRIKYNLLFINIEVPAIWQTAVCHCNNIWDLEQLHLDKTFEFAALLISPQTVQSIKK